MSRYRQLSAEERAGIKLAAHQRVEAVWTCLGVLRLSSRPDSWQPALGAPADYCGEVLQLIRVTVGVTVGATTLMSL